MSELSDILKQKREELNKTIKSAAKDTKIREQYIVMIEQASYATLPSYLHAYGFVKQYAEYLGLDYENVIKPLFNVEFPKVKIADATVQHENIERPIFSEKPRSKRATILIVLTVIAVIVVVIALYSSIFSPHDYLSNTNTNTKTSTAPAPKEKPKPLTDFNTLLDTGTDNDTYLTDNSTAANDGNRIITNTMDITTSPLAITEINDKKIEEARKQREASAAELAAKAEIAKANSAALDNTPKRLLLTFSGDCWVQYTADNLPPVEYSGSLGQSKAVSFVDSFTIDIGNAAGISFSYGRQKFENFGAEGVVLKNLRYKLVDGVLVREQR